MSNNLDYLETLKEESKFEEMLEEVKYKVMSLKLDEDYRAENFTIMGDIYNIIAKIKQAYHDKTTKVQFVPAAMSSAMGRDAFFSPEVLDLSKTKITCEPFMEESE